MSNPAKKKEALETEVRKRIWKGDFSVLDTGTLESMSRMTANKLGFSELRVELCKRYIKEKLTNLPVKTLPIKQKHYQARIMEKLQLLNKHFKQAMKTPNAIKYLEKKTEISYFTITTMLTQYGIDLVGDHNTRSFECVEFALTNTVNDLKQLASSEEHLPGKEVLCYEFEKYVNENKGQGKIALFEIPYCCTKNTIAAFRGLLREHTTENLLTSADRTTLRLAAGFSTTAGRHDYYKRRGWLK